MLKCKLCNRVTPKGEPTAKFIIYHYINLGDRKVKQIKEELNVCFDCRGECLFK